MSASVRKYVPQQVLSKTSSLERTPSRFDWVENIPTKSMALILEQMSIRIERPIPKTNIYGVDREELFRTRRAGALAEMLGVLEFCIGMSDRQQVWETAGDTLSELYGEATFGKKSQART
jgi:hypothetical protein